MPFAHESSAPKRIGAREAISFALASLPATAAAFLLATYLWPLQFHLGSYLIYAGKDEIARDSGFYSTDPLWGTGPYATVRAGNQSYSFGFQRLDQAIWFDTALWTDNGTWND